MKVLSLFSGIGGFDLGFQRAGMDIVGMCEIDKHAQKVLRKRFSNAELYDDVKKIGASNHARGSIDIICGGFPCQPASAAGVDQVFEPVGHADLDLVVIFHKHIA